jgi:hypothetical protein
MHGKSTTRYGIILASVFVTLCAHAQQQEAPQQPQDFSTAASKAKAACMALWADHVLDPLRDKFPLIGENPTLPMLTDSTRFLPKDRSLADIFVKTIEKCRALSADAMAMLPQQSQQRLQGYYREQDLLTAQLYRGKITIGEYIGLRETTSRAGNDYTTFRAADPSSHQKID